MTSETRVEIENLAEVLKAMSPELYAKPLYNFWDRAGQQVENLARDKAPRDTGRLAASMTHIIDSASPPMWCKVGTNVSYAPMMEYGTGTQTDGVGGTGKVHWPPGDALDVWASRHGFPSGKAVAFIIGRRGGLRPRRFLRDAFAQSLGNIGSFLAQLANDIGKNWSNP